MFKNANRNDRPIQVYTETGTFINSIFRKESWKPDGSSYIKYNGKSYRVYKGYPSPLKMHVAALHIVIEERDLYKE